MIFAKIEKYFFITMIFLIFIMGFFLRFQLNNIPFSGPDTIGYLGVALQFMEKDYFGQIAERSYPYPLFLTVLISTFKNTGIITLCQHSLGLIAGALFIKNWSLLENSLLKLSNSLKRIYWIIGLVGLWILLCSDWSVKIEHHTHPESITTFLILLLIYAVIKLYINAIEKNFLWSTFYAVCIFGLNYLFFVFQPRYGINLVFVGIGLIVMIFRYFTLQKAFFMILLSALLVWISLIHPFKDFNNNQRSKVNLTAALFFHNLNTIAPIIEKDLKSKYILRSDENLLKSIIIDYHIAKDPNNNYASGFNKSLGLNTDYFDRTYLRILNSYQTDTEVSDFYLNYLKKALFQDPISLIAKILKEFFYFYSSDAMFFQFPPANTLWQNSFDVISGFKAHFPTTEILTSYIYDLSYAKDTSEDTLSSNIYNSTFKLEIFLKASFPYISFLFVVMFLLSLKEKNTYLKYGKFIIGIMLLQIGFNLTISLVNTNSVQRYLNDQLAIIVFFELSAVLFIIFNVMNLILKIDKKNNELKNKDNNLVHQMT